MPPSRAQLANTVGRPRLSRTSRPKSRSILGMGFNSSDKLSDQIRNSGRRLRHKREDDISLPRHLRRPQILERRFSRHPCQQAPKCMPYDPRLQSAAPVQERNLFAVNLPEQPRSGCQTSTLLGQAMRLAEKVCQSKPHIKSRITKVNHLVIEQNQFAPIDERVFRAKIAVNQAVFVTQCLLRQRA